MMCRLCGLQVAVWDEQGRWAGDPAHKLCADAARAALEEIAEHATAKSHQAAARRALRRVA